jgi:hypothetical protein
MGPITEEINQYIRNKELSEETIITLKNLQELISPIEKQMVNSAYDQGFLDKEKGKNPIWDLYNTKYNSYLKNIKFTKY